MRLKTNKNITMSLLAWIPAYLITMIVPDLYRSYAALVFIPVLMVGTFLAVVYGPFARFSTWIVKLELSQKYNGDFSDWQKKMKWVAEIYKTLGVWVED